MNEINQETKNKIISLISALAPHAKIILFGSRARGTASKWSDIDIALEAHPPLPLELVDELASIFEATNIPYKIQIMDKHYVSKEMQEAIHKEGIVWKS